MIASLREMFDRADDAETRRILAHWPFQELLSNAPAPHSLTATKWLASAVDNAPEATVDLVQRVAEVSNHLHWRQTYTTADFDQFFLDRYGWTLLVGPSAPIQCDVLHAGILLLGADLEYPVHKHSAEEIYVILSGTASWKIGEADWRPTGPGELIHNPPWRPHGMRTDQGQPQLIGFIWKANAAEKSRFSGPNEAEEITL